MADTTFHAACVISQRDGNPNSSRCFRKFESHWMGRVPTTWSRLTGGLHNSGSFARGLLRNGTNLRRTAVEAPEQLGRAERHGGILKSPMNDIRQTAPGGRQRTVEPVGGRCDRSQDSARSSGSWAVNVADQDVKAKKMSGDSWACHLHNRTRRPVSVVTPG